MAQAAVNASAALAHQRHKEQVERRQRSYGSGSADDAEESQRADSDCTPTMAVYDEILSLAAATAQVSPRQRDREPPLPISPDCPSQWRELLEDECWAQPATRRPTFEAILQVRYMCPLRSSDLWLFPLTSGVFGCAAAA